MRPAQRFGALLSLGLWAIACVVPKLEKGGPTGGQPSSGGAAGSDYGGRGSGLLGGAGVGGAGAPTGGVTGVGGGQTSGGSSSLGGAAQGGKTGVSGGQTSGGSSSLGGTTQGGKAGESTVGGDGTGGASCGSTGEQRSCEAAGLYGPCADGIQSCRSDGSWGDCTKPPAPADTCEPGNDENCDGRANDGCECILGAVRPCSEDGAKGNCATGQQPCVGNGTWGDCDVEPADADSCEPGDDADCDGKVNEGCRCGNGDEQPCGNTPDQGVCHPGTSTCADGVWGDCVDVVYPGVRKCSTSSDNDCNGTADNQETGFCACTPDEPRPCQTHIQDGTGICHAGTENCVASADGTTSEWSGACVDSAGPSTRDCRSPEDNDCNGTADNQETSYCECAPGDTEPCDTEHAGAGLCRSGTHTCLDANDHATSSWDTCMDSVLPAPEVCTGGKDEDCDGTVDWKDCDCYDQVESPAQVALNEGYAVDSTEVTQRQYQSWLCQNPPTSGQSSSCSWNTTFTDTTCVQNSVVCQGMSCADHPQVCVDWCDAVAFCKAAGKRLCGGIGGDTAAFGSWADDTASQWYNACTAHGARTAAGYPYAQTYDPQACNGDDYSETDRMTIAVGTLDTCRVTGLSGDVFDMSGNVYEWEDSCESTGPSANCRVRGGSFFVNDSNLVCGYSAVNGRDTDASSIGFRCCSD